MECPKCNVDMDEVQCEEVTIDRCRSCQGIWFDLGEAEALSDRWIAEFIDTGDPDVGMRQNDLDTIACPRCRRTMSRFFEIEGQQIQYEQCDQHGKFFDAGEFTLWAENQYL